MTTLDPQNVTLTMFDELNETNVERTIDITNVMVNNPNALDGWEGDIIGNKKQIEVKLNEWIKERGNQQHETILTLISWSFN